MESERQAFMKAVIDNPEDDTVRAVFADWLGDRGDPLGEFIHLQLLPPKQRNQERVKELLGENAASWLGSVLGYLLPMELVRPESLECVACDDCSSVGFVFAGQRTGSLVRFRRGFPDGVRLPFDRWQRVGDTILAKSPIREVEILTRPDHPYWLEKNGLAENFWPSGVMAVYYGRQAAVNFRKNLGLAYPKVRSWKVPEPSLPSG